MSEITNTATIRVVADASGVEAGLRQATTAAEQAGRAVSEVGAGAANSTRSIETAQRNIVQAIQRTTLAMEAGGKSTAAYYEALANQRGVDANVLAPYLAQLRAVEEAQARNAQTATAQAAAQQAAQQQAAESARQQAAAQRELAQAQANRDSFIAGLREQITLFGASTEEVQRYRAAQLGAAQAADPLIAQLQALRVAQEQAAIAAQTLERAQREASQINTTRDAFLAGLREEIALFGRSAEEVRQYQAAQLNAAGAAGPLIAQLRALREAQEQAAVAARAMEQAQREAMQMNTSRDAFLGGLREQIALYGRSAEEVLQYRAAQLSASGAADQLIAQLRALRTAQEQANRAQQEQAGRDSFIESLREQAQAIGRTRTELLELRAAQLGVAGQAAPFIAQLRASEAGLNRTGTSAAQFANAMRMVPAQMNDVIVSLAGGMPPLTVLLQQGTQIRDMFGSVPAAIRGVGQSLLSLINPYTILAAGVAALAYAYSKGSAEADGYNRALVASANAAGASSSQLSAYATQISKTVGTQAQAAQALAALTTTGQVGAENLRQFGAVAVQVQKYIGRSVEDTVKDFEELGKSPVQASLKLSESYRYLTAATYEQIKALQDQGKTDEAAEVAQKAYATAFADRAAKMKDNLGVIERAWMGAKDSASSAWDVFLGVGRKKTPDQELAEVQQQIALARQPAGTRGGDSGDAAEMRRAAAASKLTELLKRETDLQKKIQQDALDAQKAAADEKLRQAGVEWAKVMEGTLSKAKQQENEIARVTKMGQDAGASPDDIKKAVDKVKQKYFDLNNVTLTQLENRRSLEKEKMAGELADLESQQKLQLISQETFLAKKRDMQVREIDLEIPIIKKQAEIASGKEDKAAREKANGELQVLLERRKNIIKGAANDTQAAEFERKKSIDDVVAGWDRAITAEREAIQQEILLFGQSDQARKVYTEQMKLELEMRKDIEKRRGTSNAYTEEEIAGYRRRTEARKAEVAEVLNEKAALAAADQLRRSNLRFSAEYIADADLRARRIMEIDAEQWQYLINNTAEGSEARKKILEQFDVWMANRQMQPVLDRWKGVIDSLDNNFQEGFRDMLTSGKGTFSSFAKSIGNTLKTSLADALYQTFLKKYVVQIVAGLAGVISGPAVAGVLTGEAATPGAGGASDPISAATAASNVYKLITGGFDKIGASVTNGVDKLLSQFGPGTIGSTGPSAAASMAGSIASIGAGALAGLGIGSAISGQYGSRTTVNAGTAVGGILGSLVPIPGIGPALGAALGGSIGGLLNRAFGMGDKEITTTGISGMISGSSLTASSYAKWHQEGGWFRSDKNGTNSTALSSDTIALITNGLNQIKAVSSSFAASIGADASSVASYSKSFNIDLGKDGKIEDGITKLLTNVGDELATRLVPNIAQFAKTGEAAASTLERLAGDFDATTQMAQLLGKTAAEAFGTAGIASAAAREHLIDLAGSASNLTSWASSYAQNFLTEEEKLAPVKKAVDAAMASLGLASVTTREQFKQVVNSLDLTTDAGARQFTSMMQLADAFAQVHAATDSLATSESSIAEERKGLQDQLDQLTMTSTQLLKKQRDALNEANRPLFDMIQMAQKLADTSSGLATFRDSVKSLHDGLLTGSLSTLTPEQQYAELRSQYDKTKAAALAGDTKAQESYDDVLTAFLTASQKLNAGDGQYQADFAMAQQDSASIAAWATGQIDTAQQQLNAMNSQTVALISANTALDTANRILESISQNTAPVSNPAYVLNTSFSVLATAIKSMRDGIKEELAGLRKDQDGQTGESIAANAEVQQSTAETIVDGFARVAARLAPSNQKVVLE